MARVNAVIARGASGDTSGSDTDDRGDEHRAHPFADSFSRDAGDPGLLDAGGAAGQRQRDNALMRIIRSIPSTAATISKLIEFIRAVVVDPVVVWAPSGDWAGVHALVGALAAEPFEPRALLAARRSAAVTNQRLLHGAIMALYPVLCSQPRVRDIFTNLLLAICEKNERYLKFVNDDAVDKLPTAGGLVLAASVEEMAANGATKA